MYSYLLETRSHTDIIHRTIPCSGFESKILTTKPLLRLHRVSQNSLVFLTFAPNKVKRFEHSLGVMHLAGKLFQSAISNTATDNLNEIFKLFNAELMKWINDRDNKQKKKEIYGVLFNDKKNYQLEGRVPPFVGIYNAHTPPQVELNNRFLYVTMYQGLRIAGLLHDVGHLPYSHTLEEVLGILRNKWGLLSDTEINKTQRNFINRIENYSNDNNDNIKLHEAITIKLIPIIESECMAAVNKELETISDAEKIDYLCMCMYSFEVARRILDSRSNDRGSIYNILHQLISGTLDADRLDYVSRDLLCSGVCKDIINYERLFMFLSFEKNVDREKNILIDSPYVLTAASKTVTDIEEFLRKRWKSYRDVNYHHSVHKSELMMRSILIELSEISIKSGIDKANDSEDISEDFLTGIISVLNALAEEVNDEKIAEVFLRLDDAWLDTLIKRKNNRCNMVDELVYGRTNYQSVIKRFEDFFSLDEKVYENMWKYCNSDDVDSSNLTFRQLFDALEKKYNTILSNEDGEHDDVLDRIDYIEKAVFDAFIEADEENYKEYVFANHKFLINDIIDSMNKLYTVDIANYGSRSKSYKDAFFSKVNQRLHDEISDSESDPTVMIGVISLNDGIGNDCIIRGKNALEQFCFFSGLQGYLYTESLLLPSLHFYCKNNVDANEKIEQLARIISEVFRDDIFACAKDIISKIE